MLSLHMFCQVGLVVTFKVAFSTTKPNIISMMSFYMLFHIFFRTKRFPTVFTIKLLAFSHDMCFQIIRSIFATKFLFADFTFINLIICL